MLKKIHKALVSPIFRLFVYVAIAFITTLSGEIGDITAEAAAEFVWWDWFKMFLIITIPPLIVIRAFIDQSLGRVGSEYTNLPDPVSQKDP